MNDPAFQRGRSVLVVVDRLDRHRGQVEVAGELLSEEGRETNAPLVGEPGVLGSDALVNLGEGVVKAPCVPLALERLERGLVVFADDGDDFAVRDDAVLHRRANDDVCDLLIAEVEVMQTGEELGLLDSKLLRQTEGFEDVTPDDRLHARRMLRLDNLLGEEAAVGADENVRAEANLQRRGLVETVGDAKQRRRIVVDAIAEGDPGMHASVALAGHLELPAEFGVAFETRSVEALIDELQGSAVSHRLERERLDATLGQFDCPDLCFGHHHVIVLRVRG